MSQRAEWMDQSAVEVEAAAWIAQLDAGGLSDADKAALREWCARSEAHRHALRRLGAIWSELDQLAVLPELAARPPAVARPARLKWNAFWAAHAAVVLVAVMIGLFVWTHYLPGIGLVEQPVQIYATQVGEVKPLQLVDRSFAHLNTDSLVEIDYRANERRVRLIKGEALFDVAKDPDRPFIVYAGANTVRAIGTRFAVRISQKDVEVVVSEGKVELTRAAAGGSGPSRPVPISSLRAQQTARLDADARAGAPVHIETVDAGELARRLSWATGVLEFDGEPLEKVVEEVSRYTPLRIEIGDPSLRQLPVGGRFRVGETQALFDVLENGFHATVTRDGDVVTITRNSQ
jgi:transmembrane sensor